MAKRLYTPFVIFFIFLSFPQVWTEKNNICQAYFWIVTHDKSPAARKCRLFHFRTTVFQKLVCSRRRMPKGKRLCSGTHPKTPGFLVCPSKPTPSLSTLDCEFLAAGTSSLSFPLDLLTSINALWCVCFPLRWLVYAHPSFQGLPRVLEVGGYSNPAAWGVDQPYVGSLHPLKIVNIVAYTGSLLFFFKVNVHCLQWCLFIFSHRVSQEWKMRVNPKYVIFLVWQEYGIFEAFILNKAFFCMSSWWFTTSPTSVENLERYPATWETSWPEQTVSRPPSCTASAHLKCWGECEFCLNCYHQAEWQLKALLGISYISLQPLCGFSWVGYEKEGYRGHQYLLEEGEYHDWRVWGGCDSELRSVRVIRAVGWIFTLFNC